MRRRPTASIVASPVLVGAVSVLIIAIAVLLAYNANQGLPFVPSYDIKAELPSGANLVVGNEVRAGGFRVGVVDHLTPETVQTGDTTRTIAVAHLKLDARVEPLATDTRAIVRPRSALGLKYLELTPGTSESTFEPGDTIPLAQTGDPVEFDDFLNTFDQGLRDDSRVALQGYGDAFAGRGQSINIALQEFPQLFTSLTRVMKNLSDPETGLDQFFVQIGQAAAQVAPVSDVQAQLFTNMAETFEAFSRDPEALQQTIEDAPATLQAGIESFPVQRPFLRDFAELSTRLRPAAQELPRSLPVINSALVEGQEVLPRTRFYNRRLEDVFRAVDELAENPNTLLGLQDAELAVDSLGGLVQHVGPYQTVCNYGLTFFNGLGEHQSEMILGGTLQRILVKTDPGLESEQYNRFGAYGANRPADVPANLEPDEPPAVDHYYAFHGQAYQPAVDARGRADCQNGQNGFLDGPLNAPGAKYGPAVFDNSELPSENDGRPPATVAGGGSHTVTYPDIPGRFGRVFMPNFRGGLGPRSVQDVP